MLFTKINAAPCSSAPTQRILKSTRHLLTPVLHKLSYK